MKKKVRDTAIFFTILYWLLIFIFVLHKRVTEIKNLKLSVLLLIFVGYIVLILLSKVLVPVFDLVLAITKKIGSLIFSFISSIVFYLILTPIALFMRLRGKVFLDHKIDKNMDSYYKDYQESEDIKKQF